MHSLAVQDKRAKLQQLMSFNGKIIMQNIIFTKIFLNDELAGRFSERPSKYNVKKRHSEILRYAFFAILFDMLINGASSPLIK